MLELQTFGGLELGTGDGERIEALAGRTKCLALLAYLAVEAPEGRVPREQVAPLLWPDRTDELSRASLRVALSQIRQATDPALVAGEGTSSLGLVRDHVRADVAAFREALEAGEERRALELYEGDFLAGVHLEGARPFQRWADQKRGHLRQEAYEAALSVGAAARKTGDLASAEDAFRQALDLAPLREEAAENLIRTLADRGRVADALQLYEAFRQRREAELEMAPSEELEKMVGELKRAPPAASGAGAERPVVEEAPSEPVGSSAEEFEGSPTPTADGPSGREPSRWGRNRRRTLLGALVAVGLLGGILAGAWHLLGAGGEAPPPAVGERTVAVLPFEVSGSGTDTWRDGMASLLSTNFDGAAGLRTIADRTVFAALEKEGYEAEATSTEQALEVARQVGAGYAVVGSASQLGEELRLTARLYETRSGARLDQVEVSGPSKSVTSLADRLTRQMLGVLLEETGEDLPSVDLTSVTTRSLTALKSFLAGERHLRAGEYEPAIEEYEAAVEADSTFALAYLGLGRANGWALNREARDRNVERAYRLSDRLPERERGAVRAQYLFSVENRNRAAADTLRRLTDAYPDDPILWYVLGEVLWHGDVPGGWPEADRAFKRAIELDPGHAVYYPHYVQGGIAVHHDSGLAADRIASLPREDWRNAYRISLDLAFGTPATRRDARAHLDTISLSHPIIRRRGAFLALLHPTERDTYEAMLQRVRERDGSEEVFGGVLRALLAANSFRQGQVREGLSRRQEAWVGQCEATYLRTMGVPVPDSLASMKSDPSELPDDAPSGRLRCVGLSLIQNDRGDELGPVLERLRESAEGEDRAQRWIDELEGYRARKSGNLEEALNLWEGENESNVWGAIWRGDLYRELGNLEEAEGWYLAAWTHPVAHERLGQLYEEMARPEEAAAAYRRFVAAWKDADEELQGRVEAARKRLQELISAVHERPPVGPT